MLISSSTSSRSPISKYAGCATATAGAASARRSRCRLPSQVSKALTDGLRLGPRYPSRRCCVSLIPPTACAAPRCTRPSTCTANVPVNQYWSVTAYDHVTHALINETDHSSRGSNVADRQRNADGSVDLYFGPTAPAGKESNWVPTGGRDFELFFRFYGPRKALFDKTWALTDLVRL